MTSIQRIIKYCAIAFAFFLIVNIFSGVILGVTAIGNIFDNDLKEEIGENNIDISNGTNIISINLRASNLIIKMGNVLKAETNNPYIDIKQEQNKLYVTEKKHNMKANNNDLVLYVPDNIVFDTFIVSTGAGNINAEAISANKMILNLGAGNVSFNVLNAYKEAEIDGGIGKLTINNGNINDLELSLGVGKSIINSNISGVSNIETGIGSLELSLLGNKTSYEINSEKGIGNINIDGISLANESTYGNGINIIDIESGIGSVDIEFNNVNER